MTIDNDKAMAVLLSSKSLESAKFDRKQLKALIDQAEERGAARERAKNADLLLALRAYAEARERDKYPGWEKGAPDWSGAEAKACAIFNGALPATSHAECAMRAIRFAITIGEEAGPFLTSWVVGDWGAIREEWPEFSPHSPTAEKAAALCPCGFDSASCTHYNKEGDCTHDPDAPDHGETVLRVQELLGITRTGWVDRSVIELRIKQLQNKAAAADAAALCPKGCTSPESGGAGCAAVTGDCAMDQATVDHPDNIAVDRFATAIKSEMAVQRDKGRGGWDDPAQCQTRDLADSMLRQIDNGEIVKAGAYAMMLFNRECWASDLVGAMSSYFQEARRAAMGAGGLSVAALVDVVKAILNATDHMEQASAMYAARELIDSTGANGAAEVEVGGLAFKTWQQMAWEDGCDPDMQPDPKHYTDNMQEEIANLRAALAARPTASGDMGAAILDAEKAMHWFSCLDKCAHMLGLPDNEPIPSGVVDAVEKLTNRAAASGAKGGV